jgi:hypothetical protein
VLGLLVEWAFLKLCSLTATGGKISRDQGLVEYVYPCFKNTSGFGGEPTCINEPQNWTDQPAILQGCDPQLSSTRAINALKMPGKGYLLHSFG